MGVKLDWDIEAEKGKHKEHREDSKQRGARYFGVFRLFLTVAAFIAVLMGIAYLIFQRWEQVNQRLELLLTDTVQAEVAALRVGDLAAFEERQRSATGDWAITQRRVYDEYQALKVSSTVILSGRVLDTVIDGQRGRVQVEEIIDGVPYVQTWFYWRYEDGWLHVPPDYTFWGDPDEITTDDYTIRYQELDMTTATAIDTALSRWLNDACSYVDCNLIPFITVDIMPIPQSTVRWQENEQNAWQLIVPSPYTARARADMPFDTELQIEVASLLAQRILNQTSNGIEPVFASDASYLHESMLAWMLGRFVQLNPETYLIQSLVDTYGINSLAAIQRNLQANSNISILAIVAGVPSIADVNVDWRDFVFWRLELEDDLIERDDEATWATLYDFSDPNVYNAAQQRYLNNFTASSRTVLETSVTISNIGLPQLVARVSVTRGFESGEEIIVFNLINGNWLRAN